MIQSLATRPSGLTGGSPIDFTLILNQLSHMLTDSINFSYHFGFLSVVKQYLLFDLLTLKSDSNLQTSMIEVKVSTKHEKSMEAADHIETSPMIRIFTPKNVYIHKV
jgi:hypothetical protein